MTEQEFCNAIISNKKIRFNSWCNGCYVYWDGLVFRDEYNEKHMVYPPLLFDLENWEYYEKEDNYQKKKEEIIKNQVESLIDIKKRANFYNEHFLFTNWIYDFIKEVIINLEKTNE